MPMTYESCLHTHAAMHVNEWRHRASDLSHDCDNNTACVDDSHVLLRIPAVGMYNTLLPAAQMYS